MVMAAPRKATRIHGALEAAVSTAVEAMTWLTPSDGAMVELALTYARQIDQAGDDQRAIGYLGQSLVGVLRSLGGAPAERKALGVEEAVRGKLAVLRAARGDRAAGVDEAASPADA